MRSQGISDLNGVHPSQHPNCIFFMDWNQDGANAQDQSPKKMGGFTVMTGALRVGTGSISGKQGLKVQGGDEFILNDLIGNLDPATHACFIEFEDIDAVGDNTIKVYWQGNEADVFGLINAVGFLLPGPAGTKIIKDKLYSFWGAVGSHREGAGTIEGPLGDYATHSDGSVEADLSYWDRMTGTSSWIHIHNDNAAGTLPFILHRMAVFLWEDLIYPFDTEPHATAVPNTKGYAPLNTAGQICSEWKKGNIISPSTIGI